MNNYYGDKLISEKLLKERIIFLDKEIDSKSASDIVSKYGFKLEDPPILTGKLKNNIGYGAEPNIDGESFNSIRSKIIDSSVRSLTADYRRRGLSINSSSYIRDLMRMIVELGSQ